MNRLLVAGVRTMVVSAAMLCFAASSYAQGWGGIEKIDLPRSQLDLAGEILQLDADQEEILNDLYETYATEHRKIEQEARRAVQEFWEENRSSNGRGNWREMGEKSRKIRAPFDTKAKDAGSVFYDDMKLLLDDTQMERWTRIEFMRRRNNVLQSNGMGFVRMAISATDVDLVAIVSDLEIADATRDTANETILRYERELDKHLDVLQKHVKKSFSGESDNMQENRAKSRELSRKIREINKRYVTMLGREIDGEEGQRLLQFYNQEAFPRVYEESNVEKSIKAARAFDDLTEEQKTQMKELSEQYGSKLDPLNREWAKAIEAAEDDEEVHQNRNWRSSPGDDSPARKARRQLDRNIEKELMQILTLEQQDKLPQRRRGWGRRGGRRGGRR